MKKLSGLAVLFFPVLAQAHAGHSDSNSMLQGFLHPLMGLDHLLLLMAIGLWLGLMGARSRVISIVALASITLLAMTLGGALPQLHVEWSLVATLVVVPVFLVLSKQWFSMAGFAIIALSMTFHGVAHGAELAALSIWWQVCLGTVLSSVLVLTLISSLTQWLIADRLLKSKSI